MFSKAVWGSAAFFGRFKECANRLGWAERESVYGINKCASMGSLIVLFFQPDPAGVLFWRLLSTKTPKNDPYNAGSLTRSIYFGHV